MDLHLKKIYFKRGIGTMGKVSNERLVYESVDDGGLSWVTSQRSTKNRIHAANGY